MSTQTRKLRFAEVLLEISQQMNSKESLNDVIAALLEITAVQTDSERATLFLFDEETGELFSRVATGDLTEEIRIKSDEGIAGHTFTFSESIIIDDAYSDDRFSKSIDAKTGYITRSILCVPVRTLEGKIIGVAQVLNKKSGDFAQEDMTHLEMMTMKASVVLQNSYYIEKTEPVFLRKLKGMIDVLFGK